MDGILIATGLSFEILKAVLIGLAIGGGVLAIAILIVRRRRGEGDNEPKPEKRRVSKRGRDKRKGDEPEEERLIMRATATPVPGAVFDIGDFSISPLEAREGEMISISFKVFNIGDTRGFYDAELRINGEKRGSLAIDLPPGGSETAAFAIVENTAGNYRVEIGGLEGGFFIAPAVLTVNAIEINPRRPKEKEQVSVTVEVANSGGITGTERLVISLRDEVLVMEEITVAAGATQRFNVTLTNLTPGMHEIKIGDVTEIFPVEMSNFFETL